jgi:hypothetical protein
MDERRKIRDRRVNSRKECLMLYYACHITERRQANLATVWKKHRTEYDIDLITRCLTENAVT